MMKHLLALPLLLALALPARAQTAQTTIDGLTAAAALQCTDEVPVWQAAQVPKTRKATLCTLLAVPNPAAAITGGTIDGAVIGGTVPAAGTFASVTGTGVSGPGAVISAGSRDQITGFDGSGNHWWRFASDDTDMSMRLKRNAANDYTFGVNGSLRLEPTGGATPPANGVGLYQPSAGILGLTSGGAEIARIDATGHLVLGGTSVTAADYVDVRVLNAGGTDEIRVFNNSSATSTQARFQAATGSANAFTIWSMVDGATPTAKWTVGSGVTGGITIDSSNAGNMGLAIPPTGNLSVNSGGNGASAIVNGFNGTIANQVRLSANSTGNAPTIAAGGTDTNVALQLVAKGTSNVLLGSVASATAASGSATYNAQRCAVTSESLTTAAGSDYVLTLTDSNIAASSLVEASVANGSNTTEGIAVNRVQPGSGSAVIHVRNTGAAALNGTIIINVAVF